MTHEEASSEASRKAKAMSNACVCGHSIEEHGHDQKYPGSTACNEVIEEHGDRCGCIAYERDESEDEDGED